MLRRFLCALAVGVGAAPAAAIDYTWSTGTAGNWTDADRWSPGGVPTGGDNATINAGGTYTVTLAGAQAANNVTLNSANATVNVAFNGGNFNLGGTLLLSAGTWRMGGFNDAPAALTGGTVTRGASGTGRFLVDGDVRFQNAAVQGQALAFGTSGALVRLAGASAFTPGSVVSFSPTQVYAESTGVVWEGDAVVNNVTFNTGVNVQLGLRTGSSLTFGPNTLVTHNDANFNGSGTVGAHSLYPNAQAMTFTNQGTIRNQAGYLTVGRQFTSPSVDVVNSGLIETGPAATLIWAENFTNAAGGVVRVTGGGEVEVRARQSLSNLGTFDVGGDGSRLLFGGRSTTAGLGAITRTGTNTVGFTAGRLDNTGATLALSAATGNYALLGFEFDAGPNVLGGNITATGGAKLEVRVLGTGSGFDYSYLTDVSVGPGVLSFPQTGGKLWLRGTSTLAANDTVTLAANFSTLAFQQTRQVDGLTVDLAGNGSSLAVFEDNALTLGPTTAVRKTGAGTAALVTELVFATSGSPTLTNLGAVRVDAGTLDATRATFTNRGLVDVAAGATWVAQAFTGGLRTGPGGTVRGAGTVTGGLTFTGADTHLRPGSVTATGRLTSGSVTLSDGTTLHLRLNGTAAGAGHDQLAVAGAVTLADAALDLTLGYAPAAADVLFLVTNDGTDAVSGTFAGLPDGATVTVGGYAATVRYAADADTGLLAGGNDVALVNFAPVPEPGLALGVAALGLVAVRRIRWMTQR